MKIPRHLKIGAHKFRVIITPDIDDNGQTNHDKNEILIRQQLPQNHKEATLIHEVFHVLNTTTNSENHGLMDSLAEQIYQVLADNKLLK